jgi:endonuclease YncB( thermonuclease family)
MHASLGIFVEKSSMRQFLIGIASLLAVACDQAPIPMTSQTVPQPAPQDAPIVAAETPDLPPTEWRIESIDWDDADSGTLNGVRFRLYSVDAPETGGVGAAVGAAECDLERERGLRAKSWMIEQTPPSTLQITATHGYDKMREPRLLVDLAANGQDIGKAGISAGHLQPWPHRGSKSLAAKPDWCRP